MTLTDHARTYATRQHAAIGQLYDGQPYATHLEAVAALARQYQHLLPPQQQPVAVAAAYTHDLIEDCRLTYNDVKTELGAEVAEISYLLATPKGRSRAERHCDAYYQEMSTSEVATFVKLCDRLANVANSASQGASGRMLGLYQREHAHFGRFLRPAWPGLAPLWQVLDAQLAQ